MLISHSRLGKKATVGATTAQVEWNCPIAQSVNWIETKNTINNRLKPNPMMILREMINFNGLVILREQFLLKFFEKALSLMFWR